MIRTPISKKSRIILGILSILLLVGGYAWLSHRQHKINPKDRTVPTFTQIWRYGVIKAFSVDDLTEERWVQSDSIATFKNLFMGMFFGIFIGGAIGMLMGCFKPLEAFFLPPVTLLAKIPPTAALAVFFTLVGTDTPLFVTIVAFGIMPTFAMSVQLAVNDVPDENLYKAQTLGASTCEMLWNVIFRQILPKVIDSIRLQIGPAMVFLMAAEIYCANVGYGYTMRILSRRSNMEVVYLYLAFLAIFGYLMDVLLRLLTAKLCPWYVRKGS